MICLCKRFAHDAANQPMRKKYFVYQSLCYSKI